MNAEILIEGSLTRQDLRRVFWTLIWRKSPTTAWALLILTGAFVLVYFGPSHFGFMFRDGLLLFTTTFLFVLLLMPEWMAFRLCREVPSLVQSRRYQFSVEGVAATTQAGNAFMAWPNISRVQETSAYLILRLQGGAFIPIAKRFFHEDQLQNLHSLSSLAGQTSAQTSTRTLNWPERPDWDLRIHYEASDFSQASVFSFIQRRRVLWILVVAYNLFVIGLWYFYPALFHAMASTIKIVIGLDGTIISLLSFHWAVGRGRLRRMPSLKNGMRMVFSGSGIDMEGEWSQGHSDWSLIARLESAGPVYLLRYRGGMLYVIPKRCVGDLAAQQDFQVYVKSHIPPFRESGKWLRYMPIVVGVIIGLLYAYFFPHHHRGH